MKLLIVLVFFIAGSITLYGQEKQTTAKKQPTETQIKEVPKNNPNPNNTKVQQQKKQVKKVQMRQQKANQTRDRQKAIQRRINHK